MKNVIADLLSPLSDRIYEIVASIPMGMVRAGVFGLIILLALWVILLPPQLPDEAEGGKVFSLKDLRVFALFVLFLQAVLYLIF